VKYAHHVDGEAHFSQDGKVITAVRKKSVPLSEANGHLFTVQLQGIEDFKRSVPRDDLEPSAKRTVIEFGFVDSSPRAVKIVGYWYTGQQLLRNNPGPRTTPVCGPRVTSETPLGKQTNGFLLAPAHGTPAADQVLLLTCEEVPQLTPEQRSLLLFVGGFDTREAVMNSSEDTTALFLLYENRASSFEELTQLLGSIDWPGSQVRLARE